MKNVFTEHRLVFMSGPETSGAHEKMKTAAEMPDTKEMSYEFAKKLFKVNESGDEVTVNPNRLVAFINSSGRQKAKTLSRWLKNYAKENNYKLSRSDIKKQARSIMKFFNPRRNRNLRRQLKQFMQKAVEDASTSKEELSKMKKLVSRFQKNVTDAITKVINSHAIQSIDAESGSTKNNRQSVIKKYLPKFKRILAGTGIQVKAGSNEVKAETNDVEKTAKVIKPAQRRKKIVENILRYKKPERLASR
ncbi:hypothetical protein GF369_02065 [Candidatus Peregrinibacteria bacterium]|nr:hypothetical protein [Candidatus Peregrinibacteria bacterium]